MHVTLVYLKTSSLNKGMTNCVRTSNRKILILVLKTRQSTKTSVTVNRNEILPLSDVNCLLSKRCIINSSLLYQPSRLLVPFSVTSISHQPPTVCSSFPYPSFFNDSRSITSRKFCVISKRKVRYILFSSDLPTLVSPYTRPKKEFS